MSEQRTVTRGFGFDPAHAPHHFAVVPDRSGGVAIVERFILEDEADAATQHPVIKVRLDAYRWERIAPIAADEFNDRLRRVGLKAGVWRKGETLIAPHLGKELTLLAWAVEDADPTFIPNMLANWRGLAPEERWWLYSTVNATSGHAEHGRERGWRKAIKIAFADNPIVDVAPGFLRDAPPHERATRRTRTKDADSPENQAAFEFLRKEAKKDRTKQKGLFDDIY